MSRLKKTLSLFLDILFPPLCVICEKYLKKEVEEAVCAACKDKIVVFRYPVKMNGIIVRAAADYRDRRVRKIIHSLKYQGIKSSAISLGNMLAEHLSFSEHFIFTEKMSTVQTAVKTVDTCIIVPVPLHPLRERKRGFNQSELIARTVGEKLGIPVETRILRRIKRTEAQMEIEDHEDRAENIRGAFAPGKDNHLVFGKTVIIIDDVLTSGSTMRETMNEIRKMKPKKIIPAVVAMAG